jgi:hypothetical protein
MEIIVLYYPSSTVSLGAVTDATTYKPGDLVVFAGRLFDGQTPLQNATLTAVAGTFLPVTGTVGSYQLVSTAQIDSPNSLYSYSALIQCPTYQLGICGEQRRDLGRQYRPNMNIVNGSVAFGSLGAGATVTSANTFSFTYPTLGSQYASVDGPVSWGSGQYHPRRLGHV